MRPLLVTSLLCCCYHHHTFCTALLHPLFVTAAIPLKMSSSDQLLAASKKTAAAKASAASFWNDKYSDPNTYTYGTEPNDFLRDTLGSTLPIPQGSSSSSSCLMLGDGEGRNGVFMAQNGFEKVVSVDISEIKRIEQDE